VVSATGAFAQTIRYVDDDTCPNQGSGTQGDPFCSIQDGIDLAVNGDTVLVLPGTYLETIDFGSKRIELRGRDGAGAQSIMAFCMNLFSDAELAALADRLDDPALVFAGDAGADAAAAVVETIRS